MKTILNFFLGLFWAIAFVFGFLGLCAFVALGSVVELGRLMRGTA